MTEQTGWIDVELLNVQNYLNSKGVGIPAFKPEPNKNERIVVDFSTKWDEQPDKFDETGDRMLYVIPLTHAGTKKKWFLSKTNPIIKEMLESGKKGKTDFIVLRTGSGKDTRYLLVKD